MRDLFSYRFQKHVYILNSLDYERSVTYISVRFVLNVSVKVSFYISSECNFRVRQIRVGQIRLVFKSAVRIRIEKPSFNRQSSSLHLLFMRERTDRRYKRTSHTIIYLVERSAPSFTGRKLQKCSAKLSLSAAPYEASFSSKCVRLIRDCLCRVILQMQSLLPRLKGK